MPSLPLQLFVLGRWLEVAEALLAAGGRFDPATRVGIHLEGRCRELFLPAGAEIGRVGLELRLVREWPTDLARAASPSVVVAIRAGRVCEAAMVVGGEVRLVDDVWVLPARRRWVRRSGAFDDAAFVPLDQDSEADSPLAGLHVAVVGCARLGSLMAGMLARAGVDQLDLIDADVLEAHSLEAIECSATDVGRPKVEAVAAFLGAQFPRVAIRPHVVPVEAPEAFELCARANLVVSAPDDNRARLTAALAATTHCRPHLDLGTGVFGGRPGDNAAPWRAGADVRLVLPGDGCLLCVGGLDLGRRPARDWREQRAGSLRSLNRLACSQGLALLLAHVRGARGRSAWMRLEVAADGEVSAAPRSFGADPNCRLCGRRRGLGDAALAGGDPGMFDRRAIAVR
jgi:hypothetical protein